MGQIGGWERAFWFDTAEGSGGHELSFGREAWMEPVRQECEAVRDAVGIMDHGGFTKFVIEGPDAAKVLDRVFSIMVPGFEGIPAFQPEKELVA